MRRMGQLLAEQKDPDKPKGGRPGNRGAAPTVSQAARNAGISKDQRVAALRVANVPERDFEAMVERAKGRPLG